MFPLIPFLTATAIATMPLCKAMVRAASDTDTKIQILRQCRCQARNGQDTCGTHKNFFNPSTWTLNVVYGNYFPSLSLDSQDPSTIFHVEHICETMLTKRIVLTQTDVNSIPAEDKNIDVMRVLSCFSSIHPLWNIKLVVKMLVHYTWLVVNQIPCENYLKSFIQNENMSGLMILRIFMPFWGKVTTMRPIIDLVLEELLDKNTKMYTLSLYHDKFLREYLTMDKYPDLDAYVSDRLLPLIHQNRKIARQIYKDRIDSMKEELMMKMWAPERIEAYYEKHGIFLLDECDPWLMAVAHGPRA